MQRKRAGKSKADKLEKKQVKVKPEVNVALSTKILRILWYITEFFLIIILAVLIVWQLFAMFSTEKTINENITNNIDKMYTVEELQQYNGKLNSKIYLGILGHVYDVTAGRIHYSSDQGYGFFAGIDGSRAFVTGEFTSEGLSDDVLTLSPSQILDVLDWKKFYDNHDEYFCVGKVIGRFFDDYGAPTAYSLKVQSLINEAKQLKQEKDDEKKKLPPCNVSWNKDSGTEFWCTNQSGGVIRDWAGYPRRYYSSGVKSQDSERCVCVKTVDEANKNPHMRLYNGCSPTSQRCKKL